MEYNKDRFLARFYSQFTSMICQAACLQFTSARLFADDTNITASGKSIEEVEWSINLDLLNVNRWLSANKLSLSIVKTEYLLIGSPHDVKHLSSEPNVLVDNESIKRVGVTKALGI